MKLRSMGNYQFGKGIGDALFLDEVEIRLSKRTGKIRYIYLKGKLMATVRAKDNFIALTISGARELLKYIDKPRFRVVVTEDVEEMIVEGRDLFAKHVVEADTQIRPMEEVVITNSKDEVVAVGKALLTGEEMLLFKHGKAVRVRMGVKNAA